MNKEEITIVFKDQTGFRISECDITTGKVVVNGIEITSVEDWEKVTKSLVDLQQRIDKAIECVKDFLCTEEYISLDGEGVANNYHELLNILGEEDGI